MNDLERRYRRLLAWYPWEHRRRYEDEMAETLVAGSKPGQRRPGVRDIADIATTAAAARVGYAVRNLTDRRWADACAVAGLLAAIVVLSLRVRLVTNYTAAEFMGVSAFYAVEIPDLAPIAIWLAVVVFALAGMRRTAATTAWCGLAFDLAITTYQPDYPVIRGHSIWLFVLGVVAAAPLSVRNEPRRGARLLGGRRLALVGLACAVGLLGSAAGMLLQTRQGGRVLDIGTADSRVDLVRLGGAAIALLLAGIAVWTLGPTLRRRIIALFAPLPALFALATILSSSYQYEFTVLYMAPEPVQLLGAALMIIVMLAVAVVFVQRREERLHLIELGRAADRRTSVTAPTTPVA